MKKVARAVLLAGLLASFALYANAEDTGAPQIAFRLEAQPLPTALNAWAAQAGMQVIWRPDENARRFRAAKVVGMLPPESALKLLLEGSGLTYSFVDPQTVAIRQAAASPEKKISWSQR